MPDKSSLLTERGIIDLYRSGKLAERVFTHASMNERGSAVALYVDLHNRGEIDFLSLTNTPTFDAITPHLFFAGQHVFCDVIPKLNAPVGEVMRAVDQLVRKGGDDLASNFPNAAFREWCRADLARAEEVVELGLENDALAQKFLTFAFEAGNMTSKAIEIFEKYSGERQLTAATALGRMVYENSESANAVIASFANELKNSPDDVLAANILMAAIGVWKHRSAEKTRGFERRKT